MSATNELTSWLITSLFILGVLLVPLGLSFLFIPEKISRIGAKLNHWVSTEPFFDMLNKPRYQERFIYRYHIVSGSLVMVFTAISLYMMLFYMDVTLVMEKFSSMMETALGKWLIESFYYILIGANILAFIVGLIILIRPSTLKVLENKANHWVDSTKPLEALDTTHDIPESIFPGNPRIFGILILIGAIFILMNTRDMLI